jgi:hypothetical protein
LDVFKKSNAMERYTVKEGIDYLSEAELKTRKNKK